MKLNVQKYFAFGESTMSRTQVQLWYNRLKENWEDVNDDARPERPSTSKSDENIEAVKKMILNNCRITIREVADDVAMSFGSCQEIFMNFLDMKRAAEKIITKILNFEQKRSSFRRCCRRSTTIQICSKTDEYIEAVKKIR